MRESESERVLSNYCFGSFKVTRESWPSDERGTDHGPFTCLEMRSISFKLTPLFCFV